MTSAVAAPERIERPTGWRPHYVDIEATVSTAFAWREAPAARAPRSTAPAMAAMRSKSIARQFSDFVLVPFVNAAFTPLDGFMGRTDYERVLHEPNATVALGNCVNAGRLINPSFLLITVEPFGVLLHFRKEIGDEDATGSGDSVND